MAMEAAVIGLFAVMLFMKEESLAPFLPFPHTVRPVYSGLR
jgi:hypothetical protein